jgi:hypothetical protein
VRDEATGGLRELQIEELRNLYSLPSTIIMAKSSRMIWADGWGQDECM